MSYLGDKNRSRSWRQQFEILRDIKSLGDEPFMATYLQCDCQATEIRIRVNAGGQEVFAPQCVDCGRQIGNCVKGSSVDREATTLWDEALALDWDERCRCYRKDMLAQYENATDDHVQNWWELYNEYLISREWKAIRNKVIAREGGQCQGCRDSRIDQVHHLTYDRVGGELLTDLVGFCNRCHDTVHKSAT